MNLAKQNHLNYVDRVNMGAYYTKEIYVQTVWEMITPYLNKQAVILDNSCGYGNFLNMPFIGKKIGNDIDTLAVKKAQENISDAVFLNHNALKNVARKQYSIDENQVLFIIGNPPYNDKTSIIRSHIKTFEMSIDNDILTRDLGMSFLLSYDKLKASFICVLHPLSYLIKPSNFKLLENFNKNYQLIKGHIISSSVFNDSSKSMQFPIAIALYKRSSIGMNYRNIVDFSWQVDDKNFKLSDFDDISHYVKKYPNKYQQVKNDDIFFWTMRDINALKRNQTFVTKHSNNSIIIDKSKLDYYIYIDVFKQFAHRVPYYFGNCNVLIDNDLFQKYKKYFILEALNRHQNLRQYFAPFDFSQTHLLDKAKQKITQYFKQLLGVHYAN